MRTVFVPAIVFLVLGALFIAFVVSSSSSLPPRVATHFNGVGHPNGWMSASGYVKFFTAFGAALPVLMVAVFYALRWLPPSLINLPRGDFWLAAERLPQTRQYLFSRGLWLGCLMLLLMIGLHYTIVRANQFTPPHLAPENAFGLMVIFLVALAFWLVTFLRHFARGAVDHGSRRRWA